jgi:hypothetical protein
MTALFGKLLIWSLAAVGLIVIAVAAWLWLSARPILEQAQSQYQALPSSVQCAGAFQPPHYPSGARELESEVSADRSVYAAACNAADMRRECAYLSGAPRWLGFRAYLGLYL